MSKIKTACFATYLAASIALISCSSQRQVQSSARHTYDPHFLEDIALEGGGHSKIKTETSTSSISRKKPGRTYSTDKPLQSKYADILGVRPQAIDNIPLYDFIENWYGVRYQLGGNDKSGIDCSGFVRRLYEDVFGTNLLRTATEQFTNCKMIWDKDRISEGDLVFFSTHGKRISHVGVYLANNHFVHASTTRGVVISSLNEEYWARHYAGAGQIPRS